VTRFCFWLGLLLCPLLVAAQDAEVTQTSIGYDTVQQAFDALDADPDASKSEYEGWTLFKQKTDGTYVLWSFTPPHHPVHPSAVRREILSKDDELFIGMAVLCHSSRPDCGQLVELFRQINERLKQKYSANPG
jgi:hypothetical protein